MRHAPRPRRPDDRGLRPAVGPRRARPRRGSARPAGRPALRGPGRRPSACAATCGRGSTSASSAPARRGWASRPGEAELWVHPLKLASGFRLDFRMPEYAEPIRGADVARTRRGAARGHHDHVQPRHLHRPRSTSSPRSTSRGCWCCWRWTPTGPSRSCVSFRTVLQYAWPGGLGGQYAFWRRGRTRLRALREPAPAQRASSARRGPRPRTSHPAHALPDAPSHVHDPDRPRARRARDGADRDRRRHRAAGGGRGGLSAGSLSRARGALRRARRATRERLARGRAADRHARRPARPRARVGEGEPRRADASATPTSGCGLVAGWGPSGDGARPGFGWFFGGDAAINSFAMAATGQWAAAAEGLRFLAKYQRADGKIPHEISQSAGVIPWFDEYPYAYYHADTTPFWLAGALAAVAGRRATGRSSTSCGRRREGVGLVPAARHGRRRHHREHDGRPRGHRGRARSARTSTRTSTWPRCGRALRARWPRWRAARGEAGARRRRRAASTRRPGRSIESRYWIEAAGHHAFGVLRSGRTNDTLTVWPATAAAFGLLEPAHARRTLSALSAARAHRRLGRAHAVDREPALRPHALQHGRGVAVRHRLPRLGHYQYERPWAGYPLVDALARLGFDWARGRHPELLSGAYYRPLDTAVPQQFFATSMLVSPIVYGLLGLEPDAPAGRARLAPQLPPEWEPAAGQRPRRGAEPARRRFRAAALRHAARARPEGRRSRSSCGRCCRRVRGDLTARLDGRPVSASRLRERRPRRARGESWKSAGRAASSVEAPPGRARAGAAGPGCAGARCGRRSTGASASASKARRAQPRRCAFTASVRAAPTPARCGGAAARPRLEVTFPGSTASILQGRDPPCSVLDP